MHVYNIHDESMQMLVVHLRSSEDRLDVRRRRTCTLLPSHCLLKHTCIACPPEEKALEEEAASLYNSTSTRFNKSTSLS